MRVYFNVLLLLLFLFGCKKGSVESRNIIEKVEYHPIELDSSLQKIASFYINENLKSTDPEGVCIIYLVNSSDIYFASIVNRSFVSRYQFKMFTLINGKPVLILSKINSLFKKDNYLDSVVVSYLHNDASLPILYHPKVWKARKKEGKWHVFRNISSTEYKLFIELRDEIIASEFD